MNDTDKDLISAYLDGETNASESAQVEALLDSDPEAFEYSNQLKQSKLEINGFFKGASMDSLEQSVDNFIAERSASNSNSGSALPRFNFGSLSAGIASMLSPSRAVGAMAAFAIIGMLVLPTFLQDEFDDPNIYTIEVSSLRSDGSQLSYEDIVTRSLYEMTGSTIRLISKVVIYEESSEIEFFLKLGDDLGDNCWRGFAVYDGKKRNFKFCQKDLDNPLRFK